jgi:hypothetical protein
MGRVIRDAQQSARSPIDNVSGRPANQVAAVMQQERWRAAYDNLPPEQRAQFIEQLRNTSGLTDDAIRQRLKLTKAEWRRTSFERSKARSPVLRPKVKDEMPPEPTPAAPEPAPPVLRAKPAPEPATAPATASVRPSASQRIADIEKELADMDAKIQELEAGGYTDHARRLRSLAQSMRDLELADAMKQAAAGMDWTSAGWLKL